MEEISKRIAKRVNELAEQLGLIQSEVAAFIGLEISRFNRIRRGEVTATDRELRILLTVKEDLEEIDGKLDKYGRRQKILVKDE